MTERIITAPLAYSRRFYIQTPDDGEVALDSASFARREPTLTNTSEFVARRTLENELKGLVGEVRAWVVAEVDNQLRIVHVQGGLFPVQTPVSAPIAVPVQAPQLVRPTHVNLAVTDAPTQKRTLTKEEFDSLKGRTFASLEDFFVALEAVGIAREKLKADDMFVKSRTGGPLGSLIAVISNGKVNFFGERTLEPELNKLY